MSRSFVSTSTLTLAGGWLVLASASCTPVAAPPVIDGEVPTVPGDPGVPTEPVTTEPEVTTAAYGQPTSLTLTCLATANALHPSCRVEVEPPQPVQVEFHRWDGLSVSRTFSSELVASSHDIPLYYMSPDVDYLITATATTWPLGLKSEDIFHTGEPPSFIGSWLEMTGTSTMGLIGTNLPCDTKDAVAVIYDTTTGDLVWYQALDPSGFGGLNEMVRFTNERTIFGETSASVVEFDLLGTPLGGLQYGEDYWYGLHHDINKHEDTVYGLAQYNPNPYDPALVLDEVILMDFNTGAEVARFQPHEHFDVPNGATGDYLHTNTVTVDTDGDIYLSWLTQTTLVKVNGDVDSPDFGQEIWSLEGTDGSFDTTLKMDWSQVDGADNFSFEHSLSLRADGRILVLDNANGRAISIAIDEKEGRATVDGAYPTFESSCGPQGTAQETAGGNVVSACWGDTVREYDGATSEMLWEAKVECRNAGFYGSVRWYPLDAWN
jgi:hypothetical protein